MSGLLVAGHNTKVKEVSRRNSAAAAAAAGTTFSCSYRCGREQILKTSMHLDYSLPLQPQSASSGGKVNCHCLTCRKRCSCLLWEESELLVCAIEPPNSYEPMSSLLARVASQTQDARQEGEASSRTFFVYFRFSSSRIHRPPTETFRRCYSSPSSILLQIVGLKGCELFRLEA
jgi:hypothetical protein